jgi:hypothetical protein
MVFFLPEMGVWIEKKYVVSAVVLTIKPFSVR